MGMTVDEWAALTGRHEERARRDPAGYRRSVMRFLALGYLVVAAALVVLAAAVAGIVYVGLHHPLLIFKVGIPLGAFALVLLRSLWIRLDPPGGIEIDRRDAPELFAAIDELNRTVRGPKLHAVLVDADFNAGVVQVPRPGLVFGSRDYLVLGLPYMQAMAPEEFRATIAHELAHLSSNHGKAGARIARVEATWWKLLESLEEKRKLGTSFFRAFFGWYLPRLRARAFPLMRAHEREADRLAVEAAGAEATAAALSRATIAAQWSSDEFWPGVFERVTTEPEPPAGALAAFAGGVRSAYAGDAARMRFDLELAREPEPDETHPGLRERLELAGVDAERAFALATRPLDGETAADAYLGPAATRLADELDGRWREAIGGAWRARHGEARSAQSRLAELERKDGTLGDDDVRLRAQLAQEFRSTEEAEARWRDVLEREPDDDEAHLALGIDLLDRDGEAALPHLEHASRSLDPEIGHTAFAAAIAWLEAQGRDTAEWRERLDRYVDVGMESGAERSEITLEDEFAPAVLDDDVVAELRSICAADEHVKRAWLVRKRLRHFDDEAPLHVLAIEPTKKWRTFWDELDAEDKGKETVADRVAKHVAELPHEIAVVAPGPRAHFEERVEGLDALIYDRDRAEVATG